MACTTAKVAPGRRVDEPPEASGDASLFVWGVWAAMLLATLFLIGRYGDPYPFYDDWVLVPVLVGEEPVTWTWLWSQQEEHRILLPRLLWLALFRSTNFDFRAGMYFNAGILGGLAFALILATKKVRGRIHYSDAFFPLTVLAWTGPDSHLLWSFLIQLVSSTVLAGIILVLIVRCTTSLAPRPTILAGTCLILLPLCGANGVGLVPALALWLGYTGVVRLLSAPNRNSHDVLTLDEHYNKQDYPAVGRKWIGFLALGFSATAVGLIPLYFLGLQKGSSPPSPSLWISLATTVQFLSMSLGDGFNILSSNESLWLYKGLAVVSVLFISVIALLVTWYRKPLERFRTLGLLFFVGAFCCLALGIGHGRGGFWPAGGLQQRYTILSVPLLCCIYFVWTITNRATGRFVQMSLFIVMCTLVLPTMANTLTGARDKRDRRFAFEQDMAAGVPISVLSQRHRLLLLPPTNPIFLELTKNGMRAMHEKGVERFRQLAADPPYQDMAGPKAPAVLYKVTLADGLARGSAGDAYMDYFLEEPQRVYAVRLTCGFPDAANIPATFSLSWKKSTQPDFPGPEQALELAFESPEMHTVTIWVNDTIDRLRIRPDIKPFVFRMAELTLCVPETTALSGETAAAPVYRLGTRIDFTQASSRPYLRGDWHGPEVGGQWSGPNPSLLFRLIEKAPLRLRMKAHTFGEQKVVILFNGRELKTFQVSDEDTLMELDIPAEAVAEVNRLTFMLPDARSPQSTPEESDDGRVLGLGVYWIEFTPSTPGGE